MPNYFVAGVGMTHFGRHLDRSMKSLVQEAVTAALGDAECDASHVDAIYFSTATNGYLQGQGMIPGQVALRPLGFDGVPITNVENACASASTAFHLALQTIKAGDADITLAVGADKMNVPDKSKMFSVFDGAVDVEDAEASNAALLAMGEGVVPPPGTTSDKPYSPFMDVYAALCRHHMKTFGTTQRQIAAVSAKNHQHSEYNEKSQFRKPFSIDEVMEAPPITYPLTLPMCSPISDGAAAAIVCNEAGLKKLGASPARSVQILASVLRSGSHRTADDYANHITALAAKTLYERAGIGPQDVDVAEVHDATAFGEIVQAENLQLAERGDAGPAAERGDFSIGGRIPINPSGGLESKGHPIGATGLGQIYELVTQLRGEAGPRQVADARIALQENGGGSLGVEEAAAVLNLFKRAS